MVKARNRYFATLLTCLLLLGLTALLTGSAAWADLGWSEHIIKSNFNGAWSVYATDMDDDGDVDILGAAYQADDIIWWENDGNENFTEHTIKSDFDGARSVYAIDVDGDTDIDILGAAYLADDIAWWENDGSENFTEHTIEGDFDGASSIYAIDIDGDTDIDILSAGYLADDITWWENDGSENFTEHTIEGDFRGAISIYAIDVDGDTDIDILGAGYLADDITWWENDGNENFTEHTIEDDFNGAHYVYATDVDSDGDIDILGAAELADDITWWENDGSENFTEHTIKSNFNGAWSVYATDVDDDGDVDILGAAQIANDIAWWENDGSENFTEHTIEGDFDGASSVYATDVSGNGDVDVLGTALYSDDITWWENGDSTLPTVASVTNPANDEYYRDATMSTVFSGTAADNDVGFGLNADSTTFTLRRSSDDLYWDGDNNWQAAAAWLATSHSATSSDSIANWTSDIDMPDWADGTYTVQAKATDKEGNSSTGVTITFGYDDTSPADPSNVHSPSHIASVWSTDNTIDITWNDATDATSGLDGYSILWNTSSNSTPNTTKDIEEGVQSTTSLALSDGSSHYFHISSVDNAGNWQSTIHLGPFYIDATPPTDPGNVRSTSHTTSVWSTDNTVDITWTDATDATSGLDGYSILWDTDSDTIPDQTKDIEEGVRAATSLALSDGNSHYFHIRSVDHMGNWQSTVHLGPFYIDTTPPAGPTNVYSTSHTIGVWSGDNTINISWTVATDATSGLDGYSILWNTSPTTTPNQTKDIEGGVRTATSALLPDGNSHYFHIRSVDNAGNWQSAVHLGPFYIDVIDITPPTHPSNVRSTSHTPRVWSGDRTVTIAWTDATDVISGLDGYSIVWDTDPDTIPNQTRDIRDRVRTTTSPALSTGNNHYFHIRSVDNDGNWHQSAVHLGPFYIDATAPTRPSNVHSTSHTIGESSTDNTIDISWTAATDTTTGLDGYSILWNTKSSTTPNKTRDIEEGVRATTSPAFSAGTYYFHIRSVDNAGNWKSAVHLGPFYIDIVDTIPPTGPTNVHSTSHTIGESSTDNTILITWTDATDATSGLDGYSILWDANPTTMPDETKDIEDGFPFTTSPDLPDGDSLYFHIRSVDNAGNWQSAVHLGPFIIDTTSGSSSPLGPSLAEFELSSLSISPPRVKIGEEITIRATVTNIGGESGSGQVIMKFNGEVLDSQTIILNAGASEEISYTTVQNAAGTYTVDINGITASSVFKEIAPTTTIMWPLIIGLAAAALAIYLIIAILRARGTH